MMVILTWLYVITMTLFGYIRTTAMKLEKNNYLKSEVGGDRKNVFGLDAKVIVTTAKGEQMQEMCPARDTSLP